MSYVEVCTKFIYQEYKEQQKEMTRLMELPADEQFAEEECLAEVIIKATKKENVYSFTFQKQPTKLRENKSVVIVDYETQRVVCEATINSLDIMKCSGVLFGGVQSGKYALISKMDFMPFQIMNSLKKIISDGPTDLIQKMLDREGHDLVADETTTENIVKSALKMRGDYMLVQGPPGTGKTYTASKIIVALLAKGKNVGITSHSHAAINNLCEAIPADLKFNGHKFCSDDSSAVAHKSFSSGAGDTDSEIYSNQVVAGTCFAFAKCKEAKLDYMIVDESGQLKFSYLLAASRLAKNIIILGDQNQLQSFSILGDDKIGSESVLGYLLGEGNTVVPKELGYFLDKTYRMEPGLANLISEAFYNKQLTHSQTEVKSGLKFVWNTHRGDDKYSNEECEDVLKIYNDLKKNKKVAAKDIMIVSPYNAQAGLLRSYIKDLKTEIGTVDMFQGREARYIIISMTYGGDRKANLEFVTNPNRLNVAISRAKEGAFIVASSSLKKVLNKEKVSPEFTKIMELTNAMVK